MKPSALSTEEINQNSSPESQVEKETNNLFLSIIAHDLRGPIGGLAASLGMAREGTVTLDKEYLDVLYESAQNAYDLLEKLLTWSKCQKEGLQAQPKQFVLFPLVQETFTLLGATAQKKKVSLNFDQGAGLWANADVDMVTTLIRNLLGNALKFTPQGGQITITAREQDGMLWVGVQDTGVGMPQSVAGTLFNNGNALTTIGTDQETGTGLGLVLCKKFVEANQGEIGVESVEGEGSLFWFTLPLGSVQEKDIKDFDYSGLRVLLVEDLSLNQKIVQMVLAKFNVEADLVENGEMAIEAAQEEEYDLILMDFNLPGMGGVQCTHILQLICNPKPSIVTLTSYEQSEIQDQLNGVVFDAFLRKPLNAKALAATLETLFPEGKPSL